ncbi:MAG: carboxypeptidase-like regulatory domain-containing protein [Nitrospirales bacterium]|nr:carboxypeptidase-like regulatory domain-containing protein [Nitrospirales bacterium]
MIGRVAFIVCLFMALSHPAWSYQEIEVRNGGTITGQVTIAGEKPRPMAFNLVTIPDAVYCGRISTGTGWRIVEDFIIGAKGELKDAVVMLKNIEKGKTFTLPDVRIDALDCDFLPFVNVLRDKDEITVVNMDPVEHDIQGYETARVRGARVLFNRPLPMNPFHKVVGLLGKNAHTHLPGEPMVEQIHLQKERNIFVMQCGFHPYMFSWGLVLNNPYYSITKEDGLFEIGGIPPGEYQLTVWHPGMKTYLEKNVTVEAGKNFTVNFQYEAPTGRRSVHEMHDNPHFGMELLGEGVEIVPTLRKQLP